jgi:hypothetical protein
MDATLNTQDQNLPLGMDRGGDKSELMQVFENHVSDMYWAYKDLLKAILEGEETEA